MSDMDTPLRMHRTRSFLKPLVARGGADLIAHGKREIITVHDRHVRCTIETPETAAHLRPIHLDGVDDLEQLLLESFIEEDVDGLELITAKDIKTSALLGLIFWRCIPRDELEHWIDPNLTDGHGHVSAHSHRDEPPERSSTTEYAQSHELSTDSFMKIELLGSAEEVRGEGVGRLLLGMALAYAQVQEGKTSVILQVAGGETNRAASHLYEGFGFEDPGPGAFCAPNRNLRVVWDIDQTLREMVSVPRGKDASAAAPAAAPTAVPAAALAAVTAATTTAADSALAAPASAAPASAAPASAAPASAAPASAAPALAAPASAAPALAAPASAAPASAAPAAAPGSQSHCSSRAVQPAPHADTYQELHALTSTALKHRLARRRSVFDDCLEKAELVERLAELELQNPKGAAEANERSPIVEMA